jgi:hypothetical protein
LRIELAKVWGGAFNQSGEEHVSDAAGPASLPKVILLARRIRCAKRTAVVHA